MKTKKLIALLLAAVCICTVFAACGKKDDTASPAGETAESANAAADVSKVATIGEAMALEGKGREQSATYEAAYVYVFELNGSFWRLTATLTPEQSEALMAVDYTEENYQEKENAILADLPVTNCENLDDQKLSDDEMNALVGKTGEELENDGWTSGSGYNLDEMEFYLNYGPFTYTVVFESAEKLENTDDFDELAAIRPLTVKSVAFNMLGDYATDLPEDAGAASEAQ